jgi:hypothetical protein
MDIARGYPQLLSAVADKVNASDLVLLTRQFLFDQLYPNDIPGSQVHTSRLPWISGSTSVYHSAVATFYAPSNYSGEGGMYRERIRATPLWKKGEIAAPRHDCVLVENDPDVAGFAGLRVARLRLFFSIQHEGIEYPCALVEWYSTVGSHPDPVTGYWKLQKCRVGTLRNLERSVIHLDCILRGAHLVPVFDTFWVPLGLNYTMTLDFFGRFYLNHHIDPHAYEVLH